MIEDLLSLVPMVVCLFCFGIGYYIGYRDLMDLKGRISCLENQLDRAKDDANHYHVKWVITENECATAKHELNNLREQIALEKNSVGEIPIDNNPFTEESHD